MAYAAIALKSGLSRADQWHLDPAILVLCFAFVLPLQARYLPIGLGIRAAGVALTVVIALTFSIGQLRIARYTFYESMVGGFQAWSREPRRACALEHEPKLPALACQHGVPDQSLTELAEKLAAPEFDGRPLFIYYGSTSHAAMVGASRAGYLTDSFIYGNERAAAAKADLEADPETLVLIAEDVYDWLQKGPDEPIARRFFALSGMAKTRELLEVLSSVHHRALQAEYDVQVGRWREFIGNWMIANYEPVLSVGAHLVLERRD